MAVSIATNAQNDIYLDRNGNLALVRNLIAVEQDCQHAIQTRLGEEIYATNAGMPYFETAFIQWKQQQFNAAGIGVLESVPNVVQVTSFESTKTGAIVNYEAQIESIYGETFING